jgi:hypothetical protein
LQDHARAVVEFVFDGKTPTPKGKSLIESLAPLLADMEARGVTDAFGDERVWPHIRRLLGFQAHCRVIPGAAPGIHCGVAHGHDRPLCTKMQPLRRLYAAICG